jgi:hypothetical protein
MFAATSHRGFDFFSLDSAFALQPFQLAIYHSHHHDAPPMFTGYTKCGTPFAGMNEIRFKPAFNPYTEPSAEIFG